MTAIREVAPYAWQSLTAKALKQRKHAVIPKGTGIPLENIIIEAAAGMPNVLWVVSTNIMQAVLAEELWKPTGRDDVHMLRGGWKPSLKGVVIANHSALREQTVRAQLQLVAWDLMIIEGVLRVNTKIARAAYYGGHPRYPWKRDRLWVTHFTLNDPAAWYLPARAMLETWPLSSRDYHRWCTTFLQYSSYAKYPKVTGRCNQNLLAKIVEPLIFDPRAFTIKLAPVEGVVV